MDQARILGGRYQLAGLLGRGGMAEVHEALDLRLNRSVAVKQLSLQLASDPSAQQRFRREAQAVARLQHPAIATVYDSGEEPDPDTGVVVPYMVMELVDGSTLRDILRSGDQLEPTRALAIIRDTLGALGHSHRAGIVHRDIKPANVMINSAGHVKVMDFGIARAADDTTGLTQTQAVIGTAQYLSPEQARGESVDQRSDLYSVGCLLYELLVARTPFVGDSSISVAYQHVRETPDPPSRHNPLLGPDIDTVVLKALAKDPADRYQSAEEMAADLTRLIDGQPVVASRPVEASTTLPRPRAVPLVVNPTGPTAVQPTRDEPPVRPVPAPPGGVTGTRGVTPEPERRSGVPRTLLVLALVLLIAGGAFGAYQLLGGGGSTPGGISSSNQAGIAVPAGLVGSDIQDVKKRLEAAGFTNVNPEKSADRSRGTKDQVLAVDPPPGTVVDADAEIVVTYQGSSGSDSGSDDETTPPPSTREPTTPASTSEPTSTKPDPTKSSSDPDPEPSVTKTSSKPSSSASASASSGSGTADPSKSAKTKKPKPEKTKTAKATQTGRASPTPEP